MYHIRINKKKQGRLTNAIKNERHEKQFVFLSINVNAFLFLWAGVSEREVSILSCLAIIVIIIIMFGGVLDVALLQDIMLS